MANTLAQRLNFLSGELKKNIAGLRKRCDKKSIHRFRVLVKRTSAFSQVLQYLTGKAWKPGKEHKKLKRLFKHAGEIRSKQVHSDLLKEFDLAEPDDASVARKAKAKREITRFMKKLKKADERKLIDGIAKDTRSGFNSASKQKLPERILHFSKNLIRKAVKLAKQSSLHKARMKLKTAHYCLEMIPGNQEAAAILSTIDPIEQKAGRWHDCLLSLQIMDAAKKKKGREQKATLLKSRDNGIAVELSRLESQINRDFNRLEKIIGVR